MQGLSEKSKPLDLLERKSRARSEGRGMEGRGWAESAEEDEQRRVCAVCGFLVGEAEPQVSLKGVKYHRRCFRCSKSVISLFPRRFAS